MSQELKITLLDKPLTIACPDGQASALLESAALLNEQMRTIQQKKPTTSLLNIALIAALNICHELLTHQQQHQLDSDKITLLTQLVEQALDSSENSTEIR
ncbi:cell division protein ZapA [Psychrobium sp. 1_MG-2023]|uniref:cell division protein ZapA n=1 Tax=Psychrobium sp. 1_MG-2023 TaxID=3062624 RepID=UPI000C3453B4|nr:cell division protein ZapA [Psychrobium sp. 1_MG-2023]MDP2560409.1 cell division protein ZapA [Psychrobium sp. 1_MG-2023]PKF57922.1 cell division protein ZapA [Alteromonadales bacterium alter-6D02]